MRTILEDYFLNKVNVDTLLGTYRFILKFYGNSFSLKIYEKNKVKLDISNLILNSDSKNVAIRLALKILE